MKIIIYLCIVSFFAAIALDTRKYERVIATDDGGKPLPSRGVVDVLTRHDRIPVARLMMGNDARKNWNKIYGYLVDYGCLVSVNPNLMIRGTPHDGENGGRVGFETGGGTRFSVGGVEFTVNEEPPKPGNREYPSVDGMLRLVRDATKEANLKREQLEWRAGCFISLYGGSWHYVPAPATNYTTMAAILSQQIITNYTVIKTPSDTVPPGLDGHHWTIQAKLNPAPYQWPERLVVPGESTGIWTHIGDGKYLWSKLP